MSLKVASLSNREAEKTVPLPQGLAKVVVAKTHASNMSLQEYLSTLLPSACSITAQTAG
ncbi:hypothetical protein D3C84_1083190 [compost metagenome]